MSTQALMYDDGCRAYSVDRDTAHNWPFVIRTVCERMEDGNWPFMDKFAVEHGLSRETLGEVVRTYCRFVAAAGDIRGEKMDACLRRVGHLDLPEAAQVMFLAHLGAVMTGIYWTGVQDAAIGGTHPALRCQELVAFGERSAKFLMMSPWKRRWHKLRARWERAVSAFFGKTHAETPQLKPQPPVARPSFPGGGPGGLPPGARAAGPRHHRASNPQDRPSDGAFGEERTEPNGDRRVAGGPDQGPPN